MTQQPFEVGKFYWTRGDGQNKKELRRVICIDAPGELPIITMSLCDSAIIMRHNLEGFCYSDGRTDCDDLLPGAVEPEKPKTRYYKWKVNDLYWYNPSAYISEGGNITNGTVWSDAWHSFEKEKINPDTDFVEV